MEITTIGLDLAKNFFQVHGIDAAGVPIVRKALRRSQMLPFFSRLSPCLVGMEACGTSHHWARELIAMGHQVRLMPPPYVKPYLKRAKTEAADAERDFKRWHGGNELSQRLATIPGIGPIGASALAASVTDPQQFRSGRQFAAWLGLTPLQKSSGGKERLGKITKMGDKYLRRLLIVGMRSLVRRAKYSPGKIDPRLVDLLARKPIRVATVAMANKTARIIWAIMSRGEIYRTGHRPVL